MSANVVALIANLNQFKTAAVQSGLTVSGNEPVTCSIDVLIAALQTLDAGGGGGSPGGANTQVQFNQAGAFGGIANVTSDGTNIALGTPISGVATNLTGLPISTGVSGLGANVATFLATPSSANLAAAVTGETGTGALVFATSPTFVTPNIDSATATSINKVAITQPATGSTLTIADGKTLTISNSITFTATDGSSINFGAGGTLAYTSANLGVFAATTSAQLAGVISDATGTGSLVFGTSPAFTSSIIIGSTTLTGPSTNLLGLGGSTAAFPGILRNATAINFRLADNSADANITAGKGTFSNSILGSPANGFGFTGGQGVIIARALSTMDFYNSGFTNGYMAEIWAPSGSTCVFDFDAEMTLRWSTSTIGTARLTGLSRVSDGVLGVGNGGLSDVSGTMQAALFSSGSTTLVTTRAALSNNAAAQLATITNGPVAGNPTKWVPINDNGTIRNIPAW